MRCARADHAEEGCGAAAVGGGGGSSTSKIPPGESGERGGGRSNEPRSGEDIAQASATNDGAVTMPGPDQRPPSNRHRGATSDAVRQVTSMSTVRIDAVQLMSSYRRQLRSKPFRVCSPRSSNWSVPPSRSSRTVGDTKTCSVVGGIHHTGGQIDRRATDVAVVTNPDLAAMQAASNCQVDISERLPKSSANRTPGGRRLEAGEDSVAGTLRQSHRRGALRGSTRSRRGGPADGASADHLPLRPSCGVHDVGEQQGGETSVGACAGCWPVANSIHVSAICCQFEATPAVVTSGNLPPVGHLGSVREVASGSDGNHRIASVMDDQRWHADLGELVGGVRLRIDSIWRATSAAVAE